LSYTNIVNSWAITPGAGVVYGMADRGTNNGNLSIMRPIDFQPTLFKREILLKIFQAQGMTWTSSILDSAEFKKDTYISNRYPKLTSTQINNSKFYATNDGTSSPDIFNMTFMSGNNIGGYSNSIVPVDFQTEVYDTGNIFTNPAFVVPVTAKYNLTSAVGFKFEIRRDTGSGPLDVSSSMTAIISSGIHVVIYNSTTSTIVGLYDLDVLGGTFGLGGNTFNAQVQLSDIQLTAGDVYYVAFKYASVSFNYGAPVTGATWYLYTYPQANSGFSASLSSNDLYEGATVNCNDLLPENIKQSDFITDIRKEYNLMFLQDKTNPNNIIIETWNDFYTGTIQNWDGKHDRNSKVKVIPMSDLDFQTLKCSYSDDGDFYNKKHQDEFKETYGYYRKDIINDFVKGEREVKLTTIAATPYAWNPASGLIVPTIVTKDNNGVTPFKNKCRSLYWSGLINLPVGIQWTFSYNNGANNVVYTQLPHLGHTNNPYNPTTDFNWGTPKKIYYTWPNQYWTTNNRYNKYYSRQINEVTDKHSKLYITRFLLNPKDISDFDFRQPIFTTINREQGVFIVNRILDYDPKNQDTVIVELLKLTHYNAFAPESVPIDVGPGGNTDTGMSRVANNNIINSPNSFNYGNDSMITGGNNNFINLNSQATLINCDNVVVAGNVVGFTGIGLSNKIIDSSYNNSIWNGNDQSITVTTGTTTITQAYKGKTIYVDASGGDVTLLFDMYNQDDFYCFLIRKDSGSNLVYVDSSLTAGTESYQGLAFPYDITIANSVFLRYERRELKIKGDLMY
jgi:hypothetical protein